MFFSPIVNIHSKKNYHALPASMRVFDTRSISNSERTILNISSAEAPVIFKTLLTAKPFSTASASLTVEAALIFPFFLFALIALIYFINMMSFHTVLQIRLEETARKINSQAYISENTGTGFPDSNLLFSEIVRRLCLSDDMKKSCNTIHIKNGEKGLYFYHTNMDKAAGTAELIVSYNIHIPFIPGNIIDIPITQKCSFKLFTGSPDNFNANSFSPIVYMTAQGSVYHTYKYCTYLIRYAEIIDKNSLTEYEKKTSRSFSPCSVCQKNPGIQQVSVLYISKTGTVYHYSRDCYHLTSHIYECNLKDVKEQYSQCSRCSQLSDGGTQND